MGTAIPFTPQGTYYPDRPSNYDVAEAKAYWEAIRRQETERKRVEARQIQLEQEERDNQIKQEEIRRKQREKEQTEIEAARKKDKQRRKIEREKMEQLLRKQAQEKIEETKKFQEMKAKFESKSSQNAYVQFKKLNTLQTIQEIGKQVDDIAVVGAIVTERADIISKELIETLDDDYKLIKSEIDRYKNYGQQMESMTDLFINEFKNAFNIIHNNNADKYLKTQQEIKEMEQEIKEENDDDVKDLLCEELHGLNALDNAIKNIESKLFLMEQYYDEMVTDSKCFRAFIGDKTDECNGLTDKLNSVAKKLQDDVNEERDVFKGKNDEQQTIFNVSFTYEEAVKSSNSVSGCIFGRIWRKLAGPKDEDFVGFGKTESKTGYVCVESEMKTYNGKDQAVGLEEIAQNIEKCKSYKILQAELKLNWKVADDHVDLCERRKNDIMKISGDIRAYKLKMKALKDKAKNENDVSENQKKLINKRLTGLCVEIQSIINTMK